MTRVLGIDFAPLNVPFERRLQTIGAIYYILLSFIFPVFSILLPIYIALFTSYWPLIVVYTIWFWYDWRSPKTGAYPSKWVQTLAIYRHFANYFPVKLHKTADLDPTHNYLIGYHPHGIISIGAYINFATNGTGVHQLFPNIRMQLCTLVGQFWTPFRREWGLLHGVIDCSRESLEYMLRSGHRGYAPVLVIGK
jgi:hypothetical protein